MSKTKGGKDFVACVSDLRWKYTYYVTLIQNFTPCQYTQSLYKQVYFLIQYKKTD